MKQIDFSSSRTLRNIAASALPLLVAQLLSLLYSIVDRIYIGWIPGEGAAALAGLGICFPIIILVTAFTNLYGTGGAPLCSIAEGKGDYPMAEHVMATAFRLLFITAIFLTAAGIIFAEPALRLFGAKEDMLVYALPYLRIYLLGTIFTMLASGLNPYINAQGFPGIGMLTIAIGAVANLLLDPLFIFVFHMGIRGAAVATVVSQGLSCAFVLSFLTRKKSQAVLKLRLSGWADLFCLDGKVGRQILGLGTVSFVMQCTNSLVSVFCNHTLMAYGGEMYVAVMTVISSIRQILDVPMLAITEGASPVLSYNYGARRPGQIRTGIWIMTAICLAYSLVMWIFLRVFPGFFIRIFINDLGLMDAAVHALSLYFLTFVFQTFQYCAQTTFKALNKKRRAIFFSIFRKVILVIPLTFLLPALFSLGTDGVFLAEPVSNVIGGCLSFLTMLLTILPELREMERKI